MGCPLLLNDEKLEDGIEIGMRWRGGCERNAEEGRAGSTVSMGPHADRYRYHREWGGGPGEAQVADLEGAGESGLALIVR